MMIRRPVSMSLRRNLRRNLLAPAGLLILVAALLLASCGPNPDRPSQGSGGAAALGTAGTRPYLDTASPSGLAPDNSTPAAPASPDAVASRGAPAAGSGLALIDVPVLASELASGWDTTHSWAAQLGKTQDAGPAGTGAWTASFAQANSGVFFAVKQDSPRHYLRVNYLGARIWINPGAQDLPLDRLSLAVLSSDRHNYWSEDDQVVPPADPVTVGESGLPLTNAALPARTWTQVQVWFNKLPSPPHGRYITGVYLRAKGMAGQALQLAGVDLIAIPDNTAPEPVTVTVIDLNSIRVNFSEDVDPVTAENPANYQISSAADDAYSAPRPPSSVHYDPDTMSALISVPDALKTGMEYSVEVQRIADFAAEPHVQAAPARLAFTANLLMVKVDVANPSHPISPLIYGIAGGDSTYLKALRPTVENWGGNPSTTYNWKLGNAWNSASDWEYRNGNFGYTSKSVADDTITGAQAVGAEVRLTLPTLGWVAKNIDNNTCSFTDAAGKCYNPGFSCAKPGAVADPNRAYVPAGVDFVVQWVKHLVDKGINPRFFALDNEPDLWGYTHYDLHPKCTTYDEILNKYLEYATAVRAVAPKAELLGPVSCCWYFYWNSAAGEADKTKHDGQDFIPWFLSQVRQHDEKAGVRTLDALDIHYYPENFYNDKADGDTAKGRLQATRSLWDKTYSDPSWIQEPVNLIPRMKQVIAENYPGTKLFLSEWNFGADKNMNGALAIADVLGIFGQEDLYAASYWQNPALNSPGFFGFKMYTNYDDQGGRFGDAALPASSSDRDQVAAYASRDGKTGKLMLMLINKRPDRPVPVTLQLDGSAGGQAALFRYGQDHQDGITQESLALAANSTVTLPAYSITLLVLPK